MQDYCRGMQDQEGEMQEREGAGQVGCRIGGMQNTLIEKIGKIDFNEYSLMGWSESHVSLTIR